MITKHHVEGYENFSEFIKNFQSNGQPTFIYYSGSKLPSGESWCSDCIQGRLCLLIKLSIHIQM